MVEGEGWRWKRETEERMKEKRMSGSLHTRVKVPKGREGGSRRRCQFRLLFDRIPKCIPLRRANEHQVLSIETRRLEPTLLTHIGRD